MPIDFDTNSTGTLIATRRLPVVTTAPALPSHKHAGHEERIRRHARRVKREMARLRAGQVIQPSDTYHMRAELRLAQMRTRLLAFLRAHPLQWWDRHEIARVYAVTPCYAAHMLACCLEDGIQRRKKPTVTKAGRPMPIWEYSVDPSWTPDENGDEDWDGDLDAGDRAAG